MFSEGVSAEVYIYIYSGEPVDIISTSELTLWGVVFRTVSSDVFLNAHLE